MGNCISGLIAMSRSPLDYEQGPFRFNCEPSRSVAVLSSSPAVHGGLGLGQVLELPSVVKRGVLKISPK